MVRRLFTFMVGAVLVGGFVAEANGKKGDLVLRVKVDFSTFDIAPGAPGAAFYVRGVICADPILLAAVCDPIGKFHCWGWLLDLGDVTVPAVVSQEWDLDGRGKIQVQGFEDEGPRAVVGGTGDFRNVRGEATGFDFSDLAGGGDEFIGTFKLQGAKKAKK